MEAVGLLRDRVATIGTNARATASASADLDWAAALLPGTSPLGLTLWHLPRTIDWLINTSILGRVEVADESAFGGLPDPNAFGFGTGLSPDQALQAAAQVKPDPLLAYSEAVHAMADAWLASLTPADLDERVPQFLERQQGRPAYATDEALAEVRHLVDLPLGMLLSRPAMAHLLTHLGEIGVIAQMGRLAGTRLAGT
jgi:hypothetical protein